MTLETVYGHRSKLVTTGTKVCFLRVARVLTLCIGRNVAVDTTGKAVFLRANALDYSPVPVIQDILEMLSAHDFHWLHANRVFIVFALGRRDIWRAVRKNTDYGRTGNHDDR